MLPFCRRVNSSRMGNADVATADDAAGNEQRGWKSNNDPDDGNDSLERWSHVPGEGNRNVCISYFQEL